MNYSKTGIQLNDERVRVPLYPERSVAVFLPHSYLTHPKHEQIARWKEQLKHAQAVLEQTLADTSMSEERRTKRIARCQEIIKDLTWTINDNTKYLESLRQR